MIFFSVRRSLHVSVALGCLLSPVSAIAAALDTPIDGEAIIVTGRVDGYRTVDTTSGTKTATPLLEVPQSISVVTAEQLSDQAIRSVADLTRLLPGVSAGQGEGHRDQITLRGNNSTADFFVDGLRDDVQYFRSFYNVDRVEVHRGPNAMVFGRGGGGGLVNRVTKSALRDETAANVISSVDSFGAWYLATDANFGFGTGGVRLNAFYEDLANHRDPFDGERWGVNPTAAVMIGEAARVEIGYEHVRDDRIVDRGIPSAFAGTLTAPAGPMDDADDLFFGRSDVNQTHFNGDIVRYRGEGQLADGLKLTSQALYGDYDKGYDNAFAASAPNTANQVAIEAYRDILLRQSFIAQTNLEWRGSTGGIDHVLLVGVEATDQDTVSERVNGFFAPGALVSNGNRRVLVPLADPISVPAVTFVAGSAGVGNRHSVGSLSQWSVYLQDQLKFTDWIELVAGLRYDKLKNSVRNDFTGVAVARTDDLWSPRVGLVVKPAQNASVYASWSRSFLPQSGDQFVTLDATAATLEPEAFDNYEFGAKWDVLPQLSLAAAVYQLDRTNTRASGPTPGSVVLTGAQRTKGMEVTAVGKVTKAWELSFGYAYTDAEISRTTSAAPAGRTVAQAPRHQLSLWNRYQISKPFGIGFGLYHQSSQFATISNATRLPAYTRIDAAVFYKIADGIEAQLNVENLTDTRYFPNAHNDNNISIGAPINARATISMRF